MVDGNTLGECSSTIDNIEKRLIYIEIAEASRSHGASCRPQLPMPAALPHAPLLPAAGPLLPLCPAERNGRSWIGKVGERAADGEDTGGIQVLEDPQTGHRLPQSD